MEKELKPFDKILVKQGVWRASFFSHYAKDGNVITTGGGVYNKEIVLPYEGNEYLLGTDNKPKHKRWRAEKGIHYFYITSDLLVTCKIEFGDCADDIKYENGNYFKNSEEADEMAEKIKKLLNGEE